MNKQSNYRSPITFFALVSERNRESEARPWAPLLVTALLMQTHFPQKDSEVIPEKATKAAGAFGGLKLTHGLGLQGRLTGRQNAVLLGT